MKQDLEKLEDLNWEELYPDPLLKVRDQIKPHRMVIDFIDQPRIPDDKCIIVKWSDNEGEHVVRFLKEQTEQIPKILNELHEARSSISNNMN